MLKEVCFFFFLYYHNENGNFETKIGVKKKCIHVYNGPKITKLRAKVFVQVLNNIMVVNVMYYAMGKSIS